MDEPENPAVVQAIMRHAKMDMTLYYSYSSKKAKWHPEIDSQLVPSARINDYRWSSRGSSGSMTMTLALEIWDAAVPFADPADSTTATSSDTAQASLGRDDIEEDASVVVLEVG